MDSVAGEHCRGFLGGFLLITVRGAILEAAMPVAKRLAQTGESAREGLRLLPARYGRPARPNARVGDERHRPSPMMVAPDTPSTRRWLASGS